jgi:hypothetical protein
VSPLVAWNWGHGRLAKSGFAAREFVPSVPLAVSVVGTRRDAVNTALSPVSPLSPLENEEVRIFILRESMT